MAAEGNSGVAAVRRFAELTQSAGKLAQRVRVRLSPPETKSTWLGPSAQLAEALAGSDASSVALVRRSRGVVTVRVSRDGALSSAKYEELVSFHNFVLGIIPGILTVGGARGALAPKVKLLATGDEATVSVSAAATGADVRPVFVVACGSDEMIGPTEDFAEVLSELSVCELPWGQFAHEGDWWGLPPVVVTSKTGDDNLAT
ncbi:hypothetical protein AB1Y20_012202 [Prymnesium parvum]|uniref:Uncharacterized protein n=1 Tax=Prymnesium parvum TaxID=97485 RepID=A0AB34IMT4_PRYPA